MLLVWAAMPKQQYTIGEAARALGVSIDTIRRWDAQGRIATTRDRANRRVVSLAEIERLRGREETETLSARNRFRGIVREVKVDGLLAQVDIDVNEPSRVVAVITRESLEELGLRPGMEAVAVVKATSVMVQR
jgi:molybdopterin-binding protein